MIEADVLNSYEMNNNKTILLTIDVEDWFQVENFKSWIPFSSWTDYKLRVEKNTHTLLNLFDTCSSRHNSIQTTFFILGWIAEKLPRLVREIQSRGHEVASHGYYHNRCDQQIFSDLKKDLEDSKKLLEDIIGSPVAGYRAPSFAVNNDILKLIEDCGYLYDSSYNSFSLHDRYGSLDLSKSIKKEAAYQVSENFYEIPVSNLKLKTQNSKSKTQNLELPWSGGGYFRLIPLPLFTAGVNTILNQNNAYIFYMHPWEIDPDQPKVDNAPAFFKFRHYLNLKSTQKKLFKFIKRFKKNNFLSCRQYIARNRE